MLDLLGIDLDNTESDKNGVAADPWGMPIKSQPQVQPQVYFCDILTRNST